MSPPPVHIVLGATLVFRPSVLAFAPVSISVGSRSPHPNTLPELTPRLSSTPDEELTITTNAITSLLGGDYAGHSATFSSADGQLIPVPEHFVPQPLIEWGQIPSCLELLSSEDVAIATAGKEIGVQLERGTVSVLPEVGCGVDNLDTMRTVETLQLSTSSESTASGSDGISTGQFFAFEENEDEGEDEDDGDEHRQVLAWQTEMTPLREASRVKVETVFSVPAEMAASIDEDDVEVPFERRIRVSFEALPSEKKISSPIAIVSERRIGDVSSGAQWGVGGGLDGRTVSKLIGKDSASKPFAKSEPLVVGSDDEEGGLEGDEVTLSLPGNIVFRRGTTDDGSWFVDLIFVLMAASEGGEGKMMISGTTTVRRIFDSDDSISPTVNCYFQ